MNVSVNYNKSSKSKWNIHNRNKKWNKSKKVIKRQNKEKQDRWPVGYYLRLSVDYKIMKNN